MAEARRHERFVEPGRSVTATGRIVYAWPPEGRFAELWGRFVACGFTDTERCELLSLLARWHHEDATIVAVTDPETGEMIDVEPDWSVPAEWLGERPPAT